MTDTRLLFHVPSTIGELLLQQAAYLNWLAEAKLNDGLRKLGIAGWQRNEAHVEFDLADRYLSEAAALLAVYHVTPNREVPIART